MTSALTAEATNAFITGSEPCDRQVFEKPDKMQRKFAFELARDRRPFFAAIRVGYSYEKALEAREWVCTSREASKYPLVYDLFLSCSDERYERERIDIPAVVEELAHVALSDMSDFIEWDTETHTETVVDPDTYETEQVTVKKQQVRLKDMSEMTPGAGRAIKELRVSAEGEISIKLHDKMAALQTLLRKLSPDVNTHININADATGPNSTKLLQSLERFMETQ